ncbi:hypothetical protein PybrP1_001471 [[Pythium] brassicae (nom. inval.)]|nr:hypothetical protein PybrP1_001471 [[Pythium] brassicae (nom. inval.)]
MKAHTEAAADAPAPPIHVGDPESTGQEGLRVLDIVGALLDQPFAAQVWILSGAVFVWMGSSGAKPSLSTLSTAISTRYSPMPLITPLVGAPEMEEQQIAQRLARRTGRQCFVSCQLPDHVPELFGTVGLFSLSIRDSPPWAG